MFGNGRKTIGVFVTQVHQEFQDSLSKGICDRAKELDYNVAFFTNFLGYGELQYEIGERSIADLPKYENLDGIIVVPDTMLVQGFEQSIKEHIKNRSRCPVVSIRQKTEEYYNVLIDNTSVLKDMIYHFVIDHGYKKINFMTGPKNHQASIDRLEAYKRILEEHNIPVEEERICFCETWRKVPDETLKQWVSDPDNRPEAILCANDSMAITICNTLVGMGLAVPDDIAVSGCDNITKAEDFSPSLTTVGVPAYEMGVEAVEKIHMHNQGIYQEKNSYPKAITTYRESCGCNVEGNREELTIRRNRIINEVEVKEKAISNNAFMSVELTGVKLMDEVDRKLASYINMNDGFSSFYMCLYKDWDSYDSVNTKEFSEKDEIIMEVGIRNGEWLEKKEFLRKNLLPPVHVENRPLFYYFNMLHYQEKCFGYTAISFYETQAYKHSYQGWLINVCNALENIRIHNELKRLVYKLEDMSIKDELTGLYNRRALNILGQKYLNQSIENQSRIMAFTSDMDKLKHINDNYGHSCGDIAIKVVADALMYAAEDDEICMRVGGDEFTVIGLEYDETKMEHFLNRFEEEVSRFNKEASCDYKVNVSYGWSILIPNEHTTIEDCLIIADSKMYQQKYEKEALRMRRKKEAEATNGIGNERRR